MTQGKTISLEDLFNRGWSREMFPLHWPEKKARDNARYCLETVRRLERRKKVREDRQRVRAGLPVAYIAGDLRDRGWTKAMIRDLLGEPEAKIEAHWSGYTYHLYRAARVEEAEAQDSFQDRVKRAKKRSASAAKAAERRREQTLTEAEHLAQQLRFRPGTPESLDDVVEMLPQYTDGVDTQTVHRWCDNFLRHECTNYEAILAQAKYNSRGQPGAYDVYAGIIRPAVDDMISHRFPTLIQPTRDYYPDPALLF